MATEFETHSRSSPQPGPVPGAAGPVSGASARMYEGSAGAAEATDSAHDTEQAVKDRAAAIWDDARETARSKLNEQKDMAAGGLGEVSGALRAGVAALHGHAQFVVGAGILGQAIDPRGPIGSAGAVGLAVKQRFDPAGVLPYSWARS